MNVGPSCSPGINAKKRCPYSEKCYRKNPIHFSEMSHPHLEKLVTSQLDGSVTVPPHLDFECSDRSQLLDQLKVLQMVLRKERDKNGGKNSTQTSVAQTESEAQSVTTTVAKAKDNISPDLKEKIERNRIAAAARRAARLKEMDLKAVSLSKPSTSSSASSSKNESIPSKDNRFNEVGQELGERIEKQCSIDGKNTQGTKRGSEASGNATESPKKLKTDNGKSSNKNGSSEANKNSRGTRQDVSGSRCTQNSKGSSLMDNFAASNSSAERDEVRRQTIEKIRIMGHKISLVEPGEFDLKYVLSAPYHYFLTRVEDSKPTYDQQFSITFPEILDKSLGEIVSSLQINFMLDAGWLCLQYLLAGQRTDMLILYGDRVDEESLPLKIKALKVQMPSPFGCHHSKVMVLNYSDNGIRVVVSTANLYSDDWENRTQGVWISPHLPRLPDSVNPSDGESPTGFKKDFERYLQKYNQPHLTEWVYMIRRADFSSVNVFFVASVPGNHKGVEYNNWGHRKLAAVLTKHATLPQDAPQWPVVAQCSSIGSLGPNYESWLSKEIVPSMSREKNQGLKSHPNFQFIYPSIDNYKQSFDMLTGASCLPYSLATHNKQQWLNSYLYQWRASSTARNRAIPHIKTYTRISPDKTEIPWLVLTSANLSKAAWGYDRNNSHCILSYEAGVVFIPEFVTGKTTFHIMGETSDGTPKLTMPYDVPLTRYKDDDKPFVSEFFSGYE